jgi:hypothetical protein
MLPLALVGNEREQNQLMLHRQVFDEVKGAQPVAAVGRIGQP